MIQTHHTRILKALAKYLSVLEVATIVYNGVCAVNFSIIGVDWIARVIYLSERIRQGLARSRWWNSSCIPRWLSQISFWWPPRRQIAALAQLMAGVNAVRTYRCPAEELAS